MYIWTLQVWSIIWRNTIIETEEHFKNRVAFDWMGNKDRNHVALFQGLQRGESAEGVAKEEFWIFLDEWNETSLCELNEKSHCCCLYRSSLNNTRFIRCLGRSSNIQLYINPLRTTVIQKLLEIIGIVRLCPSCSFATALDSDINQTTGTGGLLSMWENRCMHAAVCLLCAGQPRSASDAAKLGQFIGQFSWVTGDPIVLKGLYSE